MTWQTIAKRRMREMGVTQNELRPVLGVKSQGAVGHYLAGRREPTIAQLQAMARYLRMPIGEFLGESLGMQDSQNAQRIARFARLTADQQTALLNVVLAFTKKPHSPKHLRSTK